ncbi:N-acyl-D-amino-acid deacylase [Sphingomonas vulcanisoli]|uniref:N-acyl-D-amino-acid deacylase n=1 Tax=Sphingomonas vulcanisoli TaxID=1658060 RepID=A0ABX0TW72_9SPHN|nr:D-aminoacylase [Sphingomonas vulcanisoli]NIJ08690.1 N-acyl-D-amino-acid deacylase [Sphingomonas vulcanisoli]
MNRVRSLAPVLGLLLAGAAQAEPYDLIVRGGTVYDGSGSTGVVADIGVRGDHVVAIGRLGTDAARIIDARGLAVAHGFTNMLSQSAQSLIVDGRGQSEILQGVTLEVISEGQSPGPLNPEMKAYAEAHQGDVKYPITWTTLGGYLDQLAAKGISPNIASFVGAATVRTYVLGRGDTQPTPEQLTQMRGLVAQAMREGAMGVSTGLIYVPGTFARTPEIIALAKESAACQGIYISHMRSEGDRLIESIDELIDISRKSGAPAYIYHFKASGADNWPKEGEAIAHVEAARKAGLTIGANMYPYIWAATGLDASMPSGVQAGGYEAWAARLRDPAIRAKVKAEMAKPGVGWENLFYGAHGPENIILSAFKNPALKPYTGKTLAEVAALRGSDPADTVMDLVAEDGSRVGTFYRLMSEENVRRIAALPWVSFGSDSEAQAPEGVFLQSKPHPRAYGTFAKVLGPYVRDGVLTLPQAVRKLAALPAEQLGLKDRGMLRPGYYADIVLFDPATVADRSTLDNPQQFAVGVRTVLVNGIEVVRDGRPTGANAGRVLRGAGWTGWPGGGACGPAKP